MTFEDFVVEWKNDNDYISAHTSGSTGEPKDIRLNKKFVRRSAERTNKFFNITSTSRLHSCMAPDFIGGKMMAVRADIVNCRHTWETPSNNPLSAIKEEEVIDLVAMVPSQVAGLLENGRDNSNLRALIIGGAPTDPRLRRKICQSGLNVYESYGMTETASHIALRKVTENEGWFETFEDIKVRADERGCLVISFDDGMQVVTNDMAELESSRRFKIKGRYDNMIISGGIKINPEKVESLLSETITAPFIITSEPDEKWGESLLLRIEGTEDNCETEKLMKKMGEILPKYFLPKRIEWIKELPKTHSGKLKRK